MKNILFLFLFLVPIFLFAQYPTGTNKSRLGYQTTGDGLIWRGVAGDTVNKPNNRNYPYFQLDTVNGVLYRYIQTRGQWQPTSLDIDSLVYATRYWVNSNFFPLQGGTLTGTGGAGFIGFPSQVVAPGTPASGLNVYAQGSSFNWKGTDGYERQFASTLTGGRTYTLPDVSGTFALGTGSIDRSTRWSATNTLVAGNFTDNGTKLQALLPFQLHQWTTGGRPTGVTGYKGYNTTTGFEEGYFTSQWENYITSTGASANQVAVFSNAGKIIGNSNFSFRASDGAFSVGTPIVTGYGASFLSELPVIARFQGTLNNGIRSNFSVSTANWSRPGATTININGSIINGYDGFLHFIGNDFTAGSVSLSGFYTTKSYILGVTTGPANVSNFMINSTAINEYITGSSYPSGSNFYNIRSVLTSSTVASNTGQIAVRAAVQLSGRFLNLQTDQGVVISDSNPSSSVQNTSAALDINYSNRGFLPPRGPSTANIRRGIASVTITNGGSGYGTGAGVVITISGGGGASAAIGLTYTSGVVTAGTVILKGTGYTSAPTITISGGTGTGATATCTLEDIPDGLQFYNTATKTPQYWESTTSSWRDYGSYQSGSLGIQTYTPAQPLHVAGAARITGSAGTATAVMGRDANGDISNLGLSGLSIISGVLTSTGTADGNGIYTGSGTLSQHTTRAMIPSTGNLFFSQKFNSNADSAYFNIVNYLGGERAVNFGLTDTSSTGYSRGFFESDGAGSMNWTLETNDENGSTTVRALEGVLSLSTTAGNISLSAPVDQDVIMTGLVRAKQEGYYEINSTSSPQNLSNTYSDNFINQGGTQATFTLVFPASPEDGQILKITYNNNISTLTLDGNGNTIVGTTVTTAVEGSQRVFKFYAGEGVWIRQN